MSFEGTEWYYCAECESISVKDAVPYDDGCECSYCDKGMELIDIIDETNGAPYVMGFWVEQTAEAVTEVCSCCGNERQIIPPKYKVHKLPEAKFWYSATADPLAFIPNATQIHTHGEDNQ